MSDETVQGLADAYALIDKLPDAAQQQVGRDLAEIGKIILEAQQAAVPKASGTLEAGLSVQLQIDQLCAVRPDRVEAADGKSRPS